MRRTAIFVVALLLISCCLAAVAGAGLYFLYVPATEVGPVVLISSPSHGEQLQVGESVTIQVVARDEIGVARLELWVDGELRESQSSSLPGGISPFPLVAVWQPLAPGTHLLTARAFNAQGGRALGSVNVEVVHLFDHDGDGVPDADDLCPREPGTPSSGGCPDRDGDGTSDALDDCPDQAGLPEGEGCPLPVEEDGDGDGVLDWADTCPDEPGTHRTAGCPDADGDGVPDAEDACPAEPGLPGHEGCTVPGDFDGDGVADDEDDCPERTGLPEHDGCPDVDGDGIRDLDDRCPDRWGLAEHDGCPDSDGDGVADDEDLRPDDPGEPGGGDVADSDGDGVPDEDDLCPEDGGEPPSGCAPPDEEGGAGFVDSPEDIVPSRVVGLLLGQYQAAMTNVEFQAYEFEVFDDYDEIYCYASLGEAPEERYGPFEPAGERYWAIPDDLGSVTVAIPLGRALDILVECVAYVGDEPAIDLGSYTASHDSFDGGEIEARSTGGDNEFRAKYRLCTSSCAGGILAAPILGLYPVGSNDVRLVWRWDGEPESIGGFQVYRDGMRAACVGAHLNSADFAGPTCGRGAEFEVTAYTGPCGAPESESPRSNSEVVNGPPCPVTVRVTLVSLDTYGLLPHYVGPLLGTFQVNDVPLIARDRSDTPSFNATEPPWYATPDYYYPPDYPWYLLSGETYDVAEFFDDIQGTGGGCIHGCRTGYAPGRTIIDVELEADETVTVAGTIWESASPWEFNAVYSGSDSLPLEEIGSEGRTLEIEDRGITLTVRVEVLEGL